MVEGERPRLRQMAAALATTVSINPIDVVKTRVMNMKPGQYSGPMDCVMQTIRAEGPLALYKGFVPTFVRQAPYVMVMFLTLEQIKGFWKYLDFSNFLLSVSVGCLGQNL